MFRRLSLDNLRFSDKQWNALVDPRIVSAVESLNIQNGKLAAQMMDLIDRKVRERGVLDLDEYLKDVRPDLVSIRDWATSSGEKFWKIDDIDMMMARSKTWHDKIARENEGKGHPALYATRDVVMQFPNGWTIQRLSADDCENEGNLMGNCIDSYHDQVVDGDIQILSLRDPSNRPHISMGFTLKIDDHEIDEMVRKRVGEVEKHRKEETQEHELKSVREDYEKEHPQGEDEDYRDYERRIDEHLSGGYYEPDEEEYGVSDDERDEIRDEVIAEEQSYETEQIKGAQNAPPIDKYRGMIRDFLKANAGTYGLGLEGENIRPVADLLNEAMTKKKKVNGLPPGEMAPMYEAIIDEWSPSWPEDPKEFKKPRWFRNEVCEALQYAFRGASSGDRRYLSFIDNVMADNPTVALETLYGMAIGEDEEVTDLLGAIPYARKYLEDRLMDEKDPALARRMMQHLQRYDRGVVEFPRGMEPILGMMQRRFHPESEEWHTDYQHRDYGYPQTNDMDEMLMLNQDLIRGRMHDWNMDDETLIEMLRHSLAIISSSGEKVHPSYEVSEPVARKMTDIYANDPDRFWSIMNRLSPIERYNMHESGFFDLYNQIPHPHPSYSTQKPLDMDLEGARMPKYNGSPYMPKDRVSPVRKNIEDFSRRHVPSDIDHWKTNDPDPQMMLDLANRTRAMSRMASLSSRLDARGRHSIADRMDRVAMAFHGTPSPDKIIEEGFTGGIPHYAPEYHFAQLLNILPEESRDRIRHAAEEGDAGMASWGEEYWPNIPEALEVMYEEIERELPNAQMIWGLNYPNKDQIERYGPGLIHFDESYMDSLGETPDGLAFLYHPERGAEARIPPDIFTKVDPTNPRTWDAAMWGHPYEEEEY